MIIKNGDYNLISNNKKTRVKGNAPNGTKVLSVFSEEEIFNLISTDIFLNPDEKEALKSEFIEYLKKER